MNRKAACLFMLGLSAVCMPPSLFGGGKLKTNPPGCDPTQEDCGCSCDQVSADCIKVNIGLGETTPWTGSLGCSLKIFADDDSPSVFTPESLHAVLGGYTFKRLGQKTMADGVTPAEVVLSHPNGEAVHFVFANGESLGRPDPGVHIKMDARLQMVDSEGWATTHDPVYYDLYVGDGTKRRFLATNMTGALGALVSITDERGVVRTPADMGVDIIYDPDGVRQYLTPSRLANVTRTADFLGYDVAVYALQEPPQKDAATGMYPVPADQTVEHVSVRRENGGKRAVVTIRKGGGEPLRYVFDYAMNEWSLTRPSGMQERKECIIADGRAAQITKTDISSSGEVLAKKVKNYKWMSWGFAMTNRVEGFDGVTDTTTWTYYTSGNGKGQVKTEKRQSGLLTQYVYDNLDRLVSKTRSGPDMMTELTTYDYTPVDANDPVLPVDTRPRTVIRKLNNIECERTYYVYSPLTNIVERVGTQGSAYGGTNVLRTVTAFYPVVANDVRAGFVASIRHEDGKLDLYDYSLVSNVWIETVTHLHEQSPLPVSGKTTRDITATNRRGEILEQKTDAYIDGIWYTIARNRMTYNFEGKRITSENLAGQVTTTAWDCCHKVSEVQPDGSTMTWDYDADGHVIASSRLIPLDMTNVTWLTTCYEYDDLGRQIATWKTNYAAQVGLPVKRTRYDQLGRVIARVDQLGNTTTASYSPNGRALSITNPNTSNVYYVRKANGDTLSITGTAVTPEFYSESIRPDGYYVTRTVRGETDSSSHFVMYYRDMLGKIVREERSGFQGTVLATTHSYDSLGRIVSTVADYEPTIEYIYDAMGVRLASVRRADGQWRKIEDASNFAILDGAIWLAQTNIVSCSDFAIAPLVSSSARKLTGLTVAIPSCLRSYDIRGNMTENETLVDSSIVTSRQTLPYATNKPLSISRYGVSLMEVSVSAVTNKVAYDFLGRQMANTDGRGNTVHAEYNSLGQQSAVVDALGKRTIYTYDQFGNLASIVDSLGCAIVYEYDIRGHKIYEGGATYPVRYTYDIFGNKTSMMTYRNESLGPDSGDITTWLYDEASGAMTNKVYADGKGPTYSYTPNGKLSRRIWARGIVTDYLSDGWGNQTNIVYSDNTPTVSLTYDTLGRQAAAHDAAGITTFAYDSFGSLTNEAVIGAAGTNTIERYWDEFGRTTGYAVNGIRQTTITHDQVTGRFSTMQVLLSNNHNNSPIPDGNSNSFAWSYLSGSDLKSSLAYPNDMTSSWQYDANGQLLEVRNATSTNVISQYEYSYDALGQRIAVSRSGVALDEPDSMTYRYNTRLELTNAVSLADANCRYAYDYDDIGNRKTSHERGADMVYVSNNLNQYSLIGDFTAQFDADGNQTIVKTSNGVWCVIYDGENRPITWSCGETNLVMSYDRIGRRVLSRESVSGEIERDLFFMYSGFDCAFCLLRGTSNCTIRCDYVWDPTEKLVSVPLLALTVEGAHYYFHDGQRNVVDIIGTRNCHYDYDVFGSAVGVGDDHVNSRDFVLVKQYAFSSEQIDGAVGLIYFNYRHYDPAAGRWCSRDISSELMSANLYEYCNNNPLLLNDILGLAEPSSFLCGINDEAKVIEILQTRFPDNPERQAVELRRWQKCKGLRKSHLLKVFKKLKCKAVSVARKVPSVVESGVKHGIRCGCALFIAIEVVLTPLSAGAEPDITWQPYYGRRYPWEYNEPFFKEWEYIDTETQTCIFPSDGEMSVGGVVPELDYNKEVKGWHIPIR